MSEILWSATVTQVGQDAAELFEAGVFILFGDPVPPALAEVSLVHQGGKEPTSEITAGDQFVLGESTFAVDEVGNHAHLNLKDLGHVVVYLNSPDQPLLPGAVKASGGAAPQPGVGDKVSFVRP